MRTLKGLGYVVHCASAIRKDSGDFSVVVESIKFHPNYVIDSIHDFLLTMYYFIKRKIRITYFYVGILNIQSIIPEGNNFQEFWEHVKIKDFKYAATHKEDIFKQGKKMDAEKYIQLFKQYFINESTRRMLTIVLYGKGKKPKLKVDCNISSDKIDWTKLDIYHVCM